MVVPLLFLLYLLVRSITLGLFFLSLSNLLPCLYMIYICHYVLNNLDSLFLKLTKRFIEKNLSPQPGPPPPFSSKPKVGKKGRKDRRKDKKRK